MPEWTVPLDREEAYKELRISLEQGPIIDDTGRRLLTERTIGAIGSLRIEVLSNEHPPPHFRVSYNGVHRVRLE